MVQMEHVFLPFPIQTRVRGMGVDYLIVAEGGVSWVLVLIHIFPNVGTKVRNNSRFIIHNS